MVMGKLFSHHHSLRSGVSCLTKSILPISSLTRSQLHYIFTLGYQIKPRTRHPLSLWKATVQIMSEEQCHY